MVGLDDGLYDIRVIKALIFDCFGVIYPDTLAIVGRGFLQPDDPRRNDLRDLRIQADRGMLTSDEFWNAVAELMGTTRQEVEKRLQGITGADWELLDYIKALRKDYKTAILSNTGRDFLERVFGGKDYSVYFDELGLSYETGILKPDPRAYQGIAERLGCQPEECVMIDDQKQQCEGAEAVGMQAIQYEDFDLFKAELEKAINPA